MIIYEHVRILYVSSSYLQLFFARYVEIYQLVFDKNTYIIRTNMITVVGAGRRIRSMPTVPVHSRCTGTFAARVAHAQADRRFHSNHVLHVQQLKSAARHDSISRRQQACSVAR